MGGLARAVEKAWDSVEDVGEKAWDAAEDVVSEIASWIGIESRTEIVTDISISGLLSPGIADAGARRAAIRESGGDSTSYIQAYKTFQREYKTRYNKNFLTNLGYLPNSTATTRVLSQSSVLTYLQDIDPLAQNIQLTSIRYVTVEEAAWDWMEDNIGWLNSTQRATVAGNVYEVDIVDNGATLGMDLYQNYVYAIETNLTDNYGYIAMDSTVEIGGLLYDVPLLSATDMGGYYRTTVLQQVDGVTTVDIDTTILTDNYSIAGTLDDNQKLWIKYNRGGTEWYYYTEDSSTVPSDLYSSANIDITAIIALKEDNVIENLENHRTRRMLDKLGLSGDTFIGTIDNPDLDSAYLLTGMPVDSQTGPGMMMIYNMFDLILEGSGDLSISIDKLNMTYSFTLEKSVVNANIMPVGTYSNVLEVATNNDGVTFYRRVLRYQATETQYREIVVTNFLLTYQISGQQIEVTFASPSDLRLVLPLDLFNNLKYRDWVDIYEQSLCMIAYSYEEVRLKWWQSPAFSIVLKIVAVVLSIIAIFFPPAWALAAVAWTAATFSIAFTLMGVYLMVAVIMLAAGMAVKFALDYMVDQLGLDPALAGAIMLAASIAVSDFSELSFAAEQWLPLATRLTSGVMNVTSMYYQEKTAGILEKDAVSLKEFEEENNALLDLIDNMRSSDSINFPMDIATKASGDLRPDAWVAMATGEGMHNYRSLFQDSIDSAIDSKINVVAGR